MEETQTNLQQNMDELARQAVKIARDDYGMSLDFSPESLPVLYKLLDRAHALYSSPAYAGKNPTRTIQVWGAYLGETMRRMNNASWQENPAASENRQYSVTTPTGNIFPMEQVYLRIVPEIPNTNLKAAMIEPPTRKADSSRPTVLLMGIILLAGLAIVILIVYFK
jgi:hypothetical protein